MSSISSISSGFNPYQSTGSTSANAFKQDLNALQTSLQAGNLTAAQSAFSTLQTDFQNAPQPTSGVGSVGSTSSSTSPIQKDLQAVGTALQSGDINGAKTAFSQLQTDLKGVKGHHGHHHGGGGGILQALTSTTDASQSSTDSTSSTTGSTTTDTLLSALQTTLGSAVNQLA